MTARTPTGPSFSSMAPASIVASVEDVVDDGEQRLRGGRDVAEVLVLLLVEAPDLRTGQQLAEADDVGQGRAQLVGDVADEVVLHAVGGDERFVALHQRALGSAWHPSRRRT